MTRTLATLVLAAFAAPLLLVAYGAAVPGELGPLAHLAGTVLPGYVANTALLAALTLLPALAVGVGAAALVVFTRFPGRVFLDSALVLPLVLPPYLVAIVYRETAHRQQWSLPVESLGGAAAVLALTLYPYVYLLSKVAFRRQAARYVEAARVLGAGTGRVARGVVLPLAAPAILLGALLVLLEVVSDFGTANALGVRTLTIAVHRIWFSAFEPGLAAQVALLSALLPLLLVSCYAGLTVGRGFHVPPNRPAPVRSVPLEGRARWLAPVACAVPVVLALVVPLAVLAGWAADAFGRMDLSTLLVDVWHTLLVAAAATLASVLLGLLLGLAARSAPRSARRWRWGAGWSAGALWLVSLNYAMPAIVLGISLLFLTRWLAGTALGEWLGGTIALLLAGVTLRYTVFGHLGAESGLQGVSPRLDEAVRCAGRGRWYGLVRVLLPLSRGAVAAGGLLVFVSSIKELTLSLVLQPFDYSAVALGIYHHARVDAYPQAAVYALCLALLGVYPVWSINRWFGTR